MSDELVTQVQASETSDPGRERLQLAALATQDLIWDWDLVGHRVTWAGNTHPYFGCGPEAIAAGDGDDHRAWAQRVHPDDLAITEAASAVALREGAESWEHEYRFRRMDGVWAHVLERAFIVRNAAGRPLRVVGSLRDITTRMEGEEAKTRLVAIVASSADAIIGKTLDGIVTNWNEAAERIFGYTAAEMVGHSIYRLIPERLHEAERLLLESIRRGEQVATSETERIRKDGSRIYIDLSVSPIRDATGRVVGASSIKRDITGQRQARLELTLSEERYRALVTATSSIVWTADPEGRFLAPQRSWEDYTGQPWTEQREFGWLEAFHPEDREAVRLAWLAACEGRVLFEVQGRVWSAARKAHHHFMARGAPILHSDGTVREWIGMLMDVEDRWLTEERLRQAERMEMVGRLAGGIAHEVNNQMTVVFGAADFLSRHLPGPQEREDLGFIQRAARRTATITRQLLAYSRRQILQPQTVDLNTVIAGLAPIMERTLGGASSLSLVLEPGMAPVKADPGQLEQVLLNLILNARDAMPLGGAVRIETSTALVDLSDASMSSLEDARPGPYAMLAVNDTGRGMDPETLRHIFEPFYTTKGVGEGTGLGLATVYGIVKQSGGFVSVSSQPGAGSTFRIYLPEGTPSEIPRSADHPVAVTGGSEAILVVEDDASVRASMARSLREFGYTVCEANGGEDGLKMVQNRAGRFDLVIADVVMPGIGGRALAAELARAFPTVQVLFTSGYPGHEAVDPGMRGRFRDFIQKPVAPDDLARKVRSMLDAK